jgi:hypothetical protein
MTSAHESHDLLVVAAFAADDASPADRERALTLVETCTDCAILAADIRAIASATAVLPAPVRPRDFRLTEADAARIRPTGWRRALRSLAGPRLAFTRPLAAGLTTLGLVGVIVTSVPMGMFSGATGGAASGPGADSGAAAQAPAATPPAEYSTPAAGASPASSAAAAQDRSLESARASASAAVLQPMATLASPLPFPGVNPGQGQGGAITTSPAPTKASEEAGPVVTAGEPDVAGGRDAEPETNLFASQEAPASPLFVLSMTLLLVGLGLFLLRWTARRLG